MCHPMFSSSRFPLVLTLVLFGLGETLAQVATFDDLPLAPESYWNGSDKNVPGEYDPDYWMGPKTSYHSGFVSGGIEFANTFTEWWKQDGSLWYTSWTGWAYSNMTDVTTPGFGNQYSAYVLPNGGGYDDSANYGVYYGDYDEPFATVTGIPVGGLRGAYFTNTTYTALTMLHGDEYGYAEPFTTGDYFLLTITGYDELARPTGSVDFHLADYRNEDGTPNYIVDQWTWVDLTPLGEATRLQFELTSSDFGEFGMNTPAFFAMDNLTYVPEPSALFLLACGVAACAAGFGRRRMRKAV